MEALGLYEMRAREVNGDANQGSGNVNGRLPKVLMVVTGKGPLKEQYMTEVDRLQSGRGDVDDGWKWVRCISLWLEAEDYPVLLGSADLGICLHSSSSALDLPMKIVDMFGCGLPVCALNFACLNELVKDGQNGLIFTSALELSQQMETVLTSFPSSYGPLSKLRASLLTSSTSHEVNNVTAGMGAGKGLQKDGEHLEWNSWNDNWNKVVRPLVSMDANENHDEWIT